MNDTVEAKAADFFCSIESRRHEEDLLGSAPSADVWFMLEHYGRWGSKAFDESDLHADLKARVNTQLAEIPNSRLLLVKQDGAPEGGLRFFAAVAAANPPTLYEFTLRDYGELGAIDLAALATGDARYADHIVERKMVVVCTNGLRDQCCALNGMKAYMGLKAEFPEEVWQSSHHGGHRYSANMLAMPHGLSYGKMDQEGEDIVRKYLAGQMPLGHLRGRSTLPGPAQAAEGLLRAQNGSRSPEAYAFDSLRELDNGQFEVNFREADSGATKTIILQQHKSDELIYVSCIGDKQSPLIHYDLIGIQ
jgi:hypothetical protein